MLIEITPSEIVNHDINELLLNPEKISWVERRGDYIRINLDSEKVFIITRQEWQRLKGFIPQSTSPAV